MRAKAFALILVASSSSAFAVECRSTHDPEHRTWRLVDGRKCWIAHRMDKSTLHWSHWGAKNDDGDDLHRSMRSVNGGHHRVHPRGTEPDAEDGETTGRPGEPDPITSQDNYALLNESYWPDLPALEGGGATPSPDNPTSLWRGSSFNFAQRWNQVMDAIYQVNRWSQK